MAVKNFQHVRQSLVSAIEPHIVGSGEKFENDDSQKAGKRYFEISSCKCSSS